MASDADPAQVTSYTNLDALNVLAIIKVLWEYFVAEMSLIN